MGTTASVQNWANESQDLSTIYDIYCRLVEVDTALLQEVKTDASLSHQNGDALILQANQIDETVELLDFNAELDAIIDHEKTILTQSTNEKMQAHAKATLYCVAALLEYKAAAMLQVAIPYIQQMLTRNITLLNALSEICSNDAATSEAKEQAYSQFVNFQTQQQESEIAEKPGKQYYQYGLLCREKSKLVFLCANQPTQFESASEQLKDMRALLMK